MTETSIDSARLVLEDGIELTQWSEYSINSDFLTPTDGWSFTFGDETIWNEISARVQPDKQVQLYVGSALQLTGWIDKVDLRSDHDGGLVVSVEGRDVLKPLVKANIHPDIPFKKSTAIQLVERVVNYYYSQPPTLFSDNEANRKLVTGKTSATGKRKTSAKAEIEYVQPHPHEGVFEFLSRNLRRFGLWMWATADGNVVVSGPSYEQEPLYRIQRKRGDTGVTVPRATYTHDRTNVPSIVIVRAKSSKKEFERKGLVAQASDPGWLETNQYAEPLYIVHDQAETLEQAQAFAVQEMTRQKENEHVYTCTCVGHRDKGTGAVYAVDTLATVEDEILGVHETLYVCGRTFSKSLSGGTTTELRCVPLYSIMFSDVDAPP